MVANGTISIPSSSTIEPGHQRETHRPNIGFHSWVLADGQKYIDEVGYIQLSPQTCGGCHKEN